MNTQQIPPAVEELMRRILNLDAEMREIRRQLDRLLAAEEFGAVQVSDEEIDPEILALVGVDPSLKRSAERKELQRIVSARHTAC